jgi:hypothetical protein
MSEIFTLTSAIRVPRPTIYIDSGPRRRCPSGTLAVDRRDAVGKRRSVPDTFRSPRDAPLFKTTTRATGPVGRVHRDPSKNARSLQIANSG